QMQRSSQMAIVLKPVYPIPDRSHHTPSLTKDEDGVIDIGWCDGVLADGRPFRLEMWAQDGVSALTIFFSTKELTELDDERTKKLVVEEGLVAFHDREKAFCTPQKFVDRAGREMWSVNIVVGDDE